MSVVTAKVVLEDWKGGGWRVPILSVPDARVTEVRVNGQPASRADWEQDLENGTPVVKWNGGPRPAIADALIELPGVTWWQKLLPSAGRQLSALLLAAVGGGGLFTFLTQLLPDEQERKLLREAETRCVAPLIETPPEDLEDVQACLRKTALSLDTARAQLRTVSTSMVTVTEYTACTTEGRGYLEQLNHCIEVCPTCAR